MKTQFVIILIYFFSAFNLFAYDEVNSSEFAKMDSTKVSNNQEVSLPKFDIHLVCFDLWVILGARALITQDISIEAGRGLMVLAPVYMKDVTRLGVNYHLPFWKDLATSAILIYDKGSKIAECHYVISLSYIPITEGYVHFNGRIGGDFWYLYYPKSDLINHDRFKTFTVAFEIGISVSFP